MYGGAGVDPQVAAARMQSFTGKAVVVLVLYCVLWVPGLIANLLFYSEAKRMEQIAGQSLPGTGCLAAQLWLIGISFALVVLLIVMVMAAA